MHSPTILLPEPGSPDARRVPGAPSGTLSGPRPTIEPRQAFLMRAAELLHAYGTPAHRLERVLGKLSRALGIEAQFLSTPTSLMAAFGEREGAATHLLRIEPGGVELGKLVEFDEVLEEVEHGRLDPTRGLERLQAIAGAPPRFGLGLKLLAFGLASGTAARFFGGGWAEIGLSFALGLLLGVLEHFMQRRPAEVGVFEPTAAFCAALLSLLASRLVFPVADEIVTLASLIILLPGLTLTVSMIELATRHLVSGVARLAGAATVFLTIVFGVGLARAMGAGLGSAEHVVAGLPLWTEWGALLLAPPAFVVLFQARPRELGPIFAAGVLGYVGARLGSAWLGPELGSFLGALIVGLVANGYARLCDRPSSVPLMPGILMLVPGSIGYRSLSFFLAKDALSGMETAFQAAIVATSLVGGLLAANVVLSPRRSL